MHAYIHACTVPKGVAIEQSDEAHDTKPQRHRRQPARNRTGDYINKASQMHIKSVAPIHLLPHLLIYPRVSGNT